MKTIYKYELEIDDLTPLALPIGAEILTVQTQKGAVCMWAVVDPNGETEIRYFEMFGTGHPIKNDGYDRKYIATLQVFGGDGVFHIFEKK